MLWPVSVAHIIFFIKRIRRITLTRQKVICHSNIQFWDWTWYESIFNIDSWNFHLNRANDDVTQPILRWQCISIFYLAILPVYNSAIGVVQKFYLLCCSLYRYRHLFSLNSYISAKLFITFSESFTKIFIFEKIVNTSLYLNKYI